MAISRRAFLSRTAATALAVSGGVLLSACGQRDAGGAAPGAGGAKLASPDNPVTWPVPADAGRIADGMTPEQGATLRVYNWSEYIYKKVVQDFEKKYKKYDVKVQVSTYGNMDEAVAKLRGGQVAFDVLFPTYDYLGKLVQGNFLRPLNHSYIPNIEQVWPAFQNPWYDQGWNYSVPYTIYTTGIAWRVDKVTDDIAKLANPYDALWDEQYRGKVGILDDYREAIGMTLLKNGITDLNTADQSSLDKARADLLQLIDTMDIRATINGAYAKLPEDDFWLHQAWSGDMVGAQYYLPKGVSSDVLGFWWPEDGKGPIGNDTMVVLAGGANPVLAHLFLNFMLDDHWAVKNFSWNGYQPPLTSLDPDTLIGQGYVPETLDKAVVRQEDFDRGLFELELEPAVDQRWQDVWDEFKAGA